MALTTEEANVGKKRKRDIIPEDDDDKLEIDVNAPEPPSKKAKRKEKKASKSKSKPSKKEDDGDESEGGGINIKTEKTKEEDEEEKPKAAAATAPPKRSDYGIWIGNLPFAATRDSIRKFLLSEGGIGDADITRVHLPSAEKGQNKGFAYVDFTTSAILDIALTLSERMVQGRSVLIKNSKSFEGRPQKSAAEQSAGGNVSKKEPSKRIFVGNLSFDVTKDELADHFEQAGQVENVHMATFQDTGKCKGFAWITFADIEAAKAAVRGFVFKERDDEDDEDEEGEEEDEENESKKPKKKKSKSKRAQKWFINRIHGRELRCEFAEDAQTRYKKRFSKGKPDQEGHGDAAARAEESVEGLAAQAAAARESAGSKRKDPKMKSLNKDERQELRRKRHDARMIAPGKALANTQRASQAIVAGTGNKKTFE